MFLFIFVYVFAMRWNLSICGTCVNIKYYVQASRLNNKCQLQVFPLFMFNISFGQHFQLTIIVFVVVFWWLPSGLGSFLLLSKRKKGPQQDLKAIRCWSFLAHAPWRCGVRRNCLASNAGAHSTCLCGVIGRLSVDMIIYIYTLWKINMEPNNGGLEDDFPFQLGIF